MPTIYNVYDLKPFERAVKKIDRKFAIWSVVTTIYIFALHGKIAKQNEKIDKLSKEFKENAGTEGE